MAADKRTRQTALQRIMRSHAVSRQEDLVRLLEQQGFQATQASVSRDLRELGLVKLDGRYRRLEDLARVAAARREAPKNELVIDMQPVGANLIVLRTTNGAASTVAVEIDRLRSDDIVGTLAGDDTIFVAVRSRSSQGRALARLAALAPPP